MKFLTEEELNKLTDERLSSLLKSVKDRLKYIKYVKLPDSFDNYYPPSKDYTFFKMLRDYKNLIITLLSKRSLS